MTEKASSEPARKSAMSCSSERSRSSGVASDRRWTAGARSAEASTTLHSNCGGRQKLLGLSQISVIAGQEDLRDRATREDPRAAHEALLGVALHEQDLERVRATPQHDHRRRLPRRDGLPLEVQRLEGMLALGVHRSRTLTSRPMQKYICESCGFI